MHILGPCGPLQQPLLGGWESLLLPPQPPMGIFNQRFEALFPSAGALGCAVCFAPYRLSGLFVCDVGLRGATCCSACPVLRHSESGPLGLSVCECVALPAPFSATLSPALSIYLCVNVGPQGLLVVRLPAPFVPHSASLGPTMATRFLSAPVPVSTPPTSLDICFFFINLVLDFLAVRFSISSGCARRRSVSTYAAILVLRLSFSLCDVICLVTCESCTVPPLHP